MLALALDWKLGEARSWHPLVGFGRLASAAEKTFNKPSKGKLRGIACGVAAWLLVVVPLVSVSQLLVNTLAINAFIHCIVSALFLYIAIGWHSLTTHAQAVSIPLRQGDLASARQEVGKIVSRDTSSLEEEQVASAATESVLENGSDALFAALFWFVLFGVPGVVLYRLSNTLDAMWGYKNERFIWFGWMAARMDDLLNLIPARLTALSYALAGDRKQALAAWKEQGGTWKSPNAGPVISAGAGAINVSLGGGATYHGIWQNRPSLGPATGDKASADSIDQSISLVNKALIIWLITISLYELLL